MAAFPRVLLPNKVSAFQVPTGLASASQAGKIQRRSVPSAGRIWREAWPPLKAGEAATEGFLAWIEWAYHTQQVFTIQHLLTPGSGRPPLGAGGGTPRVNGAGLTGELLPTDGWTINRAGVVRAGDVIRIAGLGPLFRVVEDASSNASGQASLRINPPIFVGSSPANDALLTTTECTLDAMIWEKPTPPEALPGQFLAGLALTFREVP